MVRFLVRVIFFSYIQSLHLFLSSSPTRKKKAKGWGISLISVSDFYYGICLFCLIVSPFFLKQNSKVSIDDSSHFKDWSLPALSEGQVAEGKCRYKDILKQTRLLSERWNPI